MFQTASHLLILLSPNLCQLWYTDLPLQTVLLRTALGLVFLSLLLAMARRRWLVILLLLPFYVAVPFEIEYLRSFGEMAGLTVISSVFETDPDEASELLGGLPLAVTASIGLVIANLGLAAASYRSNSPVTRRSKKILAAVALIALIALSADDIKYTYPYRTMMKVGSYAIEKTKIRRYHDATKDFRFGARDASGLDAQVHVLVIGESARPQSWGLYGYPVDTTPKIAREPNTIVFTDATAMSSYTRIAVPGLLTRADARTYEDVVYRERSVIDAFAEAGYRTWWISNQRRLGKHDTLTTAMASRAHEIRFVCLNYHSKLEIDGRMLEPIRKALRTHGDSKFIVVHLRGSHFNYSRRYPEEFDVFRPSLDPNLEYRFNDRSIRTEIVNSYDNSIRYTDHLLSQLIAMLRNHPGVTTLTYVSDHGENLLDDDRNLAMHGSNTEYELKIPFFIWLSDEYASRFPDVQDTLMANRDKRVSQDNLFYTLLDLARIRHGFEDRSKILSAPDFEERDRYSLTGSMEIMGPLFR